MTTPWAHQDEAIRLALPHAGYLLAHDMGTGKTFTTIRFIEIINAVRCLILSPKSVVQVWPKELEKHVPGRFNTLALDSGSVAQKSDRLEKFAYLQQQLRKRYVVILNYDSAWRPPLGPDYNDKNRKIDDGLLLRIPWDIVVADESHRIKDPGSRVSRFTAALGKGARRRLALTGTPLGNSFLDAFGQYHFLNPGLFGDSFYRFKTNYAVMGGFNNKKVLGIRRDKEQEFHNKFYSIAHKVSARDVIQLPDVMHEYRTVELSPKARKLYDTLEQNFIVKLDSGEITAKNAMVQLLRLQQMAGGFAQKDDGSSEILDNCKLDAAGDILQDLPLSEQVVIFCVFRNEITRLREIAKKHGRSSGELSGRENDLKAWQNGELNTLVVQMRSGGVGIDLTRSRYSIYFSTGFSLTEYEQSLARQCRPGADLSQKILYFHIVGKNTVDEKVAKALSMKRDAVDYVLEELSHFRKAA